MLIQGAPVDVQNLVHLHRCLLSAKSSYSIRNNYG